MFKAGHKQAFDESIANGRRYMHKLVEKYKVNQLDYLTVCDLARKVFKCFDLNADANLNKHETKLWLEAFSAEMNTLTTNFNLSQFRAWFSKIDEDGSGTMSLSEMTRAICEFLKIEEPKV